jgi:hypothetical protein
MFHKTDSNGNPNVFKLDRNDDGLWLNNNWANPDNTWNPKNEFVFSLRKKVFSALLMGAVFLYWIIQAFLPTPKHFTDFIKPCSQLLILFMGN